MNNPSDAKFQSGLPNCNVTGSQFEAGLTFLQRKRKRESIDSAATSSWFDAKVISVDQAQTASATSFHPVETILRAHLPLSWLSNESRCGILHPGVYLQAEIQSVSKWDYSILVARTVRSGDLYAIEKVDHGKYVCFPLRDFVSVEWVRQAAIGATPQLDFKVLQPPSYRTHRKTASVTSNAGFRRIKDEPGSPKVPQNRRGMLARQSILAKQTNGEMIGDDHSTMQLMEEEMGRATPLEDPDFIVGTQQDGCGDGRQESVVLDNGLADDLNDWNMPEQSNAQDLATPLQEITIPVDQLSPDYLRKRYLEMLYLSKTSLAFYAKGPLSRTRARARAEGATMDLKSLANFYRDSILPVKKLDLKYKQSLQAKISSLSTMRVVKNDKNENSGSLPQRPTSKKSRRTKLGKDALWPVEDEFIEEWWHNSERSHHSRTAADTLESEMERNLPLLRMREAELQIILILEVLALEAQQKSKEANATEADQDVPVESLETTITGNSPTVTPAKRKRNLKLDLEVLLDRLCILHSIGFDELAPRTIADDGERRSSASGTRDDLKDFCKDVIIPFYSNKLSDECKYVCQKLGWLETSPQRRKPGEDKARTAILPGTAISNRIPASGKRTLDRVLSDEHSLRSVPPPALSRSSTLPPAVNLKREPSERPISRGGVQKSLSFSNREIDLVADAQVTAAKRRKLDRIMAQKRELEAAIDALKKPNRSAAAKIFMDDVESRSTDSRLPSRKNNPVQITATPKISRTKSVSVDEYDLPPMVELHTRSEMAFVPSSTTKPRGLGHISSMAKSSAKKKAVLSAIHNTPCRDHDPKRVGADPETESDAGNFPALPNQSSSTLVNLTPVPSRLRPDLIQTVLSTPMPVEKGQQVELVTPVKRSQANVEDVFKDVPELRDRATRMMDRVMKVGEVEGEVSIYDSLGWNNNDDDDYDI